jgi:hypothetical protein
MRSYGRRAIAAEGHGRFAADRRTSGTARLAAIERVADAVRRSEDSEQRVDVALGVREEPRVVAPVSLDRPGDRFSAV